MHTLRYLLIDLSSDVVQAKADNLLFINRTLKALIEERALIYFNEDAQVQGTSGHEPLTKDKALRKASNDFAIMDTAAQTTVEQLSLCDQCQRHIRRSLLSNRPIPIQHVLDGRG